MHWRMAALALSAVGICVFLVVRNSPPIKLDPLLAIDSATFVGDGGTEIGTIDLRPVRNSMVAAEWISNSPINKGSYDLQLDGFPDIHVSDFNGYFWIEGQRGFFKVSEKQQVEFDAHFRKAVSELLDRTNEP